MNWKLTLLLVGILCPIFSFSQICDNVTNGGEIGYDQTLCAPGDDPAELVNITLPTGGSGDLEYIWISTTSDPTTVTTVWNIIPGSTEASYDPSPLFETTYFRRCARRTGCTQYIAESNIIRICVDMANPVFTSVLIDSEIECSESPIFTTPIFDDDCDLLIDFFFADDTLQNGCTTSYIRTFSIVDDCGKTAETTQTITTTDNEAPIITLNTSNQDIMDGDTLVAECDNLMFLTSGNASAIDNCDSNPLTTFSENVENSDCSTDGFLQLWTCIWTAMDACGNVSTFIVYVKVVDTTAPIFVNVPDDETIQCNETPDFGIPTFSDNCDSDLTETVTQDTSYSACSTEFSRTWTITDNCGNSTTATQFILAIDNIAPIISLNPPYANIENGDTLVAECDAIPFFDANSVALTDDCDDNPTATFIEITADGDCATVGHLSVTTLIWTAADACGNLRNFSISIRIVDTTPPTIVSVPNITVASCDDPLIIDGLAMATDNCDDLVEVTFTVDTIVTFEEIKYQINWTAKDDCLNSADTLQVITVPCNTAFLFTNIWGEFIGNTVLVKWTGMNEYPSGVYNLQHSKDGANFTFLNAPIPAEGVMRDFVDYAGWNASPYEGHNYYRVQYIDERGQLTYSEMIRMDLEAKNKVKIFPNPSYNYLIVELNDFSEEAVTVELLTQNGIILETYQITAGENSLRIEMENLHAGMYFLIVRGGNTRPKALRFVKSD